MLALITNDDGVDSSGIRALASAAVANGLDVMVAAPSWDSSGASAALTAVEQDGRLLVAGVEWSVPGVSAVYAVEAAPAYIVRAALTGAFGDIPDLVLSGINHGPNTGRAILHSGTVGAALTAGAHGVRGLAVSVAVPPGAVVSGSGRADGLGGTAGLDTAQLVAERAIALLLATPQATVLNVNAPFRATTDERAGDVELVTATLSSFGAVQATLTERGHGYVKLGYRAVDAEDEPGTDAALLSAGHATVTAVQAISEWAELDLVALGASPPGERPSARSR